MPEFYALLDRALQCDGWNPREGVVEDIRDLTGIPPLTCIMAMTDYFMTRRMPEGLRHSAVALPRNSEGLEQAIRAASVLSTSGPVDVRGFDAIDAARPGRRQVTDAATPFPSGERVTLQPARMDFRTYFQLFWVPAVASAALLLVLWSRDALSGRFGTILPVWFLLALTAQSVGSLASGTWIAGLVLQAMLAVGLILKMNVDRL